MRWCQRPLALKRADRGNIFAMLFGAVALTGVLASVGMQTLSGPITTIARVTQKNLADNNLVMSAKIIVNAAVTGTAGGDIDNDGMIEPAPFVAAAGGESPPAGGGFLPTDLGLTLTDPWGNKYGYCVWDHGSSNTSEGRLAGDTTTGAATQYVLAVIAAGPDKQFQTTCSDYSGSPVAVAKAAGTDDLIFKFTYAEASASSNGLWTLNPTDQAKAELKDSGGTVNVTIDRSTGIGDFLGVTTDTLAAKNDAISIAGGLKLDSETSVTTCEPGDAGTVRYNSTSGKLEICDGLVWKPAGTADATFITQTPSAELENEQALSLLATGVMKVASGTGVVSSGAVDLSGNEATGILAAGRFPALTGEVTTTAGSLVTSVADDILDFSEFNDAMSLDASTDIAIDGTKTLSITNTGTAASLRVNDEAYDATPFVIDSSGNVGIGNSSPNALLTVDDGSNAPIISLYRADPTYSLRRSGTVVTLDSSGFTSINGAAGVSIGTGSPRTTGMMVKSAGVIIGGTISGGALPAARLDVVGGVKPGADAICNASKAGMIAWNANQLQVCDGTTFFNVRSIAKLDDIGDVEAPTPNNNEILAWDSSSATWKPKNVNTVGSAIAIPGGTDKVVQFNDSGTLAGASQLFWDKANNRLGVGVSGPQATLDVYRTRASLMNATDAVAQLRAESMDNLGTSGDPVLLRVTSTFGGAPKGRLLQVDNNLSSFVLQNSMFGMARLTQGVYESPVSRGAGIANTLFGLSHNAALFDGYTPLIGYGANLNVTSWGGSTSSYRDIYGSAVRVTGAAPGTGGDFFGYYADVTGGDKNYAVYAKSGLSYFADPVAVGTVTPNNAAIVDLTSTARGFLPPRMTTAQRDAIASPPDGLVVFNSQTQALNIRASGAWVAVGITAGGGLVSPTASATLYVDALAADDTGNGLTTTTPKKTLCAAFNVANQLPNEFVHIMVRNTDANTRVPLGASGCSISGKRIAISTPTPGCCGTPVYIDWNRTVQMSDASIYASWWSENRADILVTSAYMFAAAGGSSTFALGTGRIEFNVNNSSFLYSRYARSNSDFFFDAGTGTVTATDGVSGVMLHYRILVGNELRVALNASGQISSAIDTAGAHFVGRVLASKEGRLGIGTPTPSQSLSFGLGNHTIGIERPTTAAAGYALTLQAGGSGAGSTDLSGGTLVLAGGTTTGTGTSKIEFRTSGGAATGTTDSPPTTKMTLLGNGNLGIGTATPHASALLDVTSTTKGLLPPRMTTAQRDAIPSPASGLMVYNTSTNQYQFWTGSAWSGIGSSQWVNGAAGAIYYSSGSVGIGTSTPSTTLDVNGTFRVGNSSSSVPQAVFENNSGNTGSSTSIAIRNGGTGLSGLSFQGGTTTYADIVQTAASSTLLYRADGHDFRTLTNTQPYALIGLFSDGGRLQLRDRASPSTKVSFAANGTSYLTGGNVGIGTSSPSTALEIVGTAKTSGPFWSAFGVAGTHRGLILENFDATASTHGVDMAAKLGGIEFQGLSWVKESGWTAASASSAKDAMIQFGVLKDGAASLPMVIKSDGNVGIGTTTPASALHVPDGRYAQFEDFNAGPPPASDCDSDTERGRQSIDTANFRLYICMGASRGWDFANLND